MTVGAPHPELAHAFLDFTWEAEIAAEICRTLRSRRPTRRRCPCCRRRSGANLAIFPPAEVLARTELIEDLEETTALYHRLWTEVKTS